MTTRIKINISDIDKRLLEKLAQARKITLAELLRDVIWAYLLPIKGK